MTKSNTQSVRIEAETATATATCRIPTFEEVYEMPYVQESISYILAQTIKKNPRFESSKDDICQEMLLALNNALPKYDGRASLNTFIRTCLENTTKNIIRKMHSDGFVKNVCAEDISVFENPEENIDTIGAGNLRAFVSQCRNNIEEDYLERDLNETVNSLPEPERTIAIELLSGKSVLQIEKKTGIPDSTISRKYIPSIRLAMRKRMR